jgi:malonyl-CoA O-methyltransferase
MDRQPLTDQPATLFSARVRSSFGRRAPFYGEQASLQRAVAWRLAHHLAPLPLPQGARADLGAGTGLLGQALQTQRAGADLLQLDLCPELLARNPLAATGGQRVWDLERGLPAELGNASLLCSSFALQWLADPPLQLRRWCRSLAPGGWLALAVPTAGCFPEWQLAAARAAVACTALPLPEAASLESVAHQELQPMRLERLRFSRRAGDGRHFLRSLRSLGASPSPLPPLGTPQLRRLLQHWPAGERITWELLVLVGQRC